MIRLSGWARILTSVVFALGSGACAREGATRSSPVGQTADPLSQVADLVALVPEGAELVVVARPQAIFGDPGCGRIARALMPEGERTPAPGPLGLSLGDLDELVLARFDGGGLWIGRGQFDAPSAVRARGEAMTSVDLVLDTPEVVRSGYLGTTHHHLRALGANAFLDAFDQAGGPLSTTLEWLRTFRDPEARGGPMASPDLAALWPPVREAELAILFPGHLPLPDDSGPGRLLAGQRGFAAALQATGGEAVRLHVHLWGRFPPDAESHFRAWATSLAESDFGRLLGMARALPTFSMEVDARRVDLSLELGAPALARGVRLLLVAEIPEILEGREM